MTEIHFDTVEEMIRFADEYIRDDEILMINYNGKTHAISRILTTYSMNVTLYADGEANALDTLKDKYKHYNAYYKD